MSTYKFEFNKNVYFNGRPVKEYQIYEKMGDAWLKLGVTFGKNKAEAEQNFYDRNGELDEE